MTSVSINIKCLRKLNKMTQDELAEKMHVTRQTISNWETGKNQPDIDTLDQLVVIFGTDINYVIYGNKRGDYPRFQRKYVMSFVVCVVALVAFAGVRIIDLPYFRELWKKAYRISVIGAVLNFVSWSCIYWTIGYGSLSLFSWWKDCSLKKNIWFGILATLFLLPMLFSLLCVLYAME